MEEEFRIGADHPVHIISDGRSQEMTAEQFLGRWAMGTLPKRCRVRADGIPRTLTPDELADVITGAS